MKYVWASWRNAADGLTAGERVKGFKTKHIRGYGCAVSFSATEDVIWSSPQPTYSIDNKSFEASVVKG